MIIIGSLLCNQNCPYCRFKKNLPLYNKSNLFSDNLFLDTIENNIKINKDYNIRVFGAEFFLVKDNLETIFKIDRFLEKKQNNIKNEMTYFINTNFNINKDKTLGFLKALKKYINKENPKFNFNIIITFSFISNSFKELRGINSDTFLRIKDNITLVSNFIKENNLERNISLINNYVINTEFLKKESMELIKDINKMTFDFNLTYTNILPLAYNENTKKILEKKEKFIDFLKVVKRENNKYQILPNIENYFENSYTIINNKFYIPLYPRNTILDYYGNISYNLINYEEFSFMKSIKHVNNEEEIIKILKGIQNIEEIEKEWNEYNNLLDKRYLKETKELYKITNEILYN